MTTSISSLMTDLTWTLMATGAAVIHGSVDNHVVGGGYRLLPIECQNEQPAGVIVTPAFTERFSERFTPAVTERVADAFNEDLAGVLTTFGFSVVRTTGRGQPLVTGRTDWPGAFG